jgi:hypothetical protein
MTRRRLLCGLLLASAVLACFAGWLWTTSGPRVTRARFEQVKEGMSRDEVIHTVGGPPGNYSRDDTIGMPTGLRYHRYESWICDDGELAVRFDAAGTVSHAVVLDVWNLGSPTLTERIRRRLRL